MISYFKINDPYRLITLLIISLIISLPLFIDAPPLTVAELKDMVIGEKIGDGYLPAASLVDPSAPLAAWIQGVFSFLFGKSLLARHIVGFIVLFLEAILIGAIFISRKVFTDNSYLPSLLYIILAFFSFDTLALSGDLMASLFLLISMSYLFKEIEFNAPSDENILKLAVFLSIASLFAFSYSIYLPAACLVLIIFSRRSLRSVLLLLTGFALPHGLLVCLYLLKGKVNLLVNYYYFENMFGNAESLVHLQGLLYLCAVPLLFLIFAFILLARESRFTKYQSQLLQVTFFWLVFGVLQALWSNDLRPQSLLPIIPCLVLFINHFFLVFRKKRLAEISFWIFTISIVAISYLARYDFLKTKINYSTLFVEKSTTSVENKKILSLQNDVSVFVDNTLATGFFNWQLSREIFLHPEYYENVILVGKEFKRDAPQVILDPENVMMPFLEKIPALKRMYVKEGTIYQLISN